MTRGIFGLALAAALLAGLEGSGADAWTAITHESNPALPGNEIQYLGLSLDGGVWVGTLQGAAKAGAGGVKTVETGGKKDEKRSVWWIHEAPDRLFIGHQQGVLEKRGEAGRDALPGLMVAPVVEVAPGVFWALARKAADAAAGLYEYRDNSWKPVESLAKKQITNLYRIRDGRIWLTLEGNGVLEIDPAAGAAKAVHHLEGQNVTAVYQDNLKRVWCGLWADGLAVWDGTAWRRELPKEKKSAILALAEDTEGRIWAATSASGLWKRSPGRGEWENDLSAEGGISLLAATRDGRIWISGQTVGGLRYWDGAAWVVSLDSPLPIRALAETADGTLWAGGVLDGLYTLKKAK